jgi:hypothetical protein
MDGSLTIDRLSRSLIDLLGTIHTLEACEASGPEWLRLPCKPTPKPHFARRKSLL